MVLENKNAVIYGAGGAIGKAVAKAFAKEGARVFLTGRNLSKLEILAKEILTSGGKAEVAVVDALDENAVNKHLDTVIEKFGSLDISFNAIGIPQEGVQGIPLMQLSPDSLVLPVTTYSKSYFITGKAAANHMVAKKSGVIMTVTATPARIASPLVGGMAPAWATLEALTRTMATEFGPLGIRVVCLRTDGMPDSDVFKTVLGIHAKGEGMPSAKEFQTMLEGFTLLKRLTTLPEMANVAAFVASDQASAMTGTVVNLSCGSIVD